MTTYPDPPVETRESRWLWFDFLAGPVIWVIYFIVGYGLVEFACKLGLLQSNWWGFNALAVIIVALTGAALLFTLYAGFIAYGKWRQLRREAADQAEPGRAEQSRLFMTLAGMMLSGLFALTILLTGVPAFILRPC